MDDLLLWGLILLGASAALMVLELVVPSGGALGFVAAGAAIAGVVCLWNYDTQWGVGSLLGVVVLGPAIVIFGLRMYPYTPMGRRMIGMPSDEEVLARREQEEAVRRERRALVGKEGIVRTECRPIGTVEVEGKRYDALSETVLIRAGVRVRVTAVEGNELKVRPVA